MKITPFYAKGWESNSFLVSDNGHAALIDAGVSVKAVLDALQAENAKLDYILLTHGHFDHTLTADALREATGAKLLIHADDAEMLTDANKSALALFLGRYDTVKPCDEILNHEDSIALGDSTLTVIHTPGHSKGSLCYLADDFIFTGDTLFDRGFGRFDLHGGDFETLKSSLRKLGKLDRKLKIYAGHGTSVSLGEAIDYLTII